MPVTLKKSGPGVAGLKKQMDQLRNMDVLIGIPADKASRKKDVINNASLLFLHTHGSELKHIPARPVLEPSIALNREIISDHLGLAAKAITDNKPDTARRELAVTGQLAANAAKRYVMEGTHLAPNKPSTIRRKKSSRPLIDTSQMVKAITYVVRENGTVQAPKKQVAKGLHAATTSKLAEIEDAGAALGEVAEI